MVDDVFRGRAVLDDRMSPALRNIRNEWQRFNSGMQLGAARREVDGLRGSLRNIGSELTTFTLPALTRFGGAGGAVAAAAFAIGGAVLNYSKKMQDLGIASKELGLSVRSLRAFEHAAGNVRIDPGAAMKGMESFRKNAEDFQLKIGGLRDELRSLGAGDVVEAISKARDPMEQLRISFHRMEELQKRNPAIARRYAEAMFGSAQFARMGWVEFQKAFEHVGEMSAADLAKAEKLNKSFNELGSAVEKLKQSASVELIPGVTKGVEAITAVVDGFGKLDALAEKWTGRKGGVYGAIFGHPMGEEAEKPPIDPMGTAKDYGMSEGDVRRKNRSQRPGDWRLPGFREDRKEETQEGTKKGVFEGLKEYFQLSSATGAAGFMNASLGNLSGGRMGPGIGGQWGNQQFPNIGGSQGGLPAPSPRGGSGATLPGGVDRSGAAAPPAGTKAQNAQRIYNELRRLGHSHEQASAALGHAQHESGFNPSVKGDGGTAHGFWQHRGDRWALAQKLAKEAGASPYSPEQAARHFDHELRNKERAAGRDYFNSKTTKDAVTALNQYERFAGWQRGQAGRYSSAEGFAKRMKETGDVPKVVQDNRDMIAGKKVTEEEKAGVVGNTDRKSFDDMWSDRIDSAIKPQTMNATGNVNVTVTAPPGTKTDAKSEGLFQSTSIKRIKQMEPSEYGQSE